MGEDFVGAMRRSVSSIRLESYRPPAGDDRAMVAVYLWDMALAREMVSPLHAAELSLRNGIHEALATRFETPLWFYKPGLLEPGQLLQLGEALENLARRKAEPTAGRIVAELMFGFWVSLLSKNYEERLWQPHGFELLCTVFPHATGQSISQLRGEYGQLRLFRNRVFHHEAIWDRKDLPGDYRRILKSIGWINPAWASLIEQDGMFDRIYDHGTGYRAILDAASW